MLKITDYNLLGQIAKQLNVTTNILVNGISEEQCKQISYLKIDESQINLLDYFKNIKELEISGSQKVKDFKNLNLNHFENLEELRVFGAKNISEINLNNLSKLAFINISGNSSLEKINGIENLNVLTSLQLINNSVFSSLDIKTIYEKFLCDMKLDINIIASIKNLEELKNIKQNLNNIQWIESVGNRYQSIYFGQGISLEYKKREILDSIISYEMSDYEKISIIYDWIVNNIKYNDLAIKERDELISKKSNASSVSVKLNSLQNSSYSALIDNNCVCEGYSNAMKFLLSGLGISAETVPCKIGNKNNQDYIKFEEADHSIIRFKLNDTWLYSDPTFDSSNPTEKKYFALTKDEITKNFTLSESEKNIISKPYNNEELKTEKENTNNNQHNYNLETIRKNIIYQRNSLLKENSLSVEEKKCRLEIIQLKLEQINIEIELSNVLSEYYSKSYDLKSLTGDSFMMTESLDFNENAFRQTILESDFALQLEEQQIYYTLQDLKYLLPDYAIAKQLDMNSTEIIKLSLAISQCEFTEIIKDLHEKEINLISKHLSTIFGFDIISRYSEEGIIKKDGEAIINLTTKQPEEYFKCHKKVLEKTEEMYLNQGLLDLEGYKDTVSLINKLFNDYQTKGVINIPEEIVNKINSQTNQRNSEFKPYTRVRGFIDIKYIMFILFLISIGVITANFLL